MSKNIVKDVHDASGKVDKETGLGWDPVKQTIIASDEWWEKKVKVQIVVASMALHNFIRNHSMTYQEFQSYDDDDDDELLPPGHEEDHRDEEIVDENFTHRRDYGFKLQDLPKGRKGYMLKGFFAINNLMVEVTPTNDGHIYTAIMATKMYSTEILLPKNSSLHQNIPDLAAN
ncbi:hypothetical protein ACFX15_042154 [Malus domestica]